LHPVEVLDFLLGWTTIDIVNDDSPAAKPKPAEAAKPAAK